MKVLVTIDMVTLLNPAGKKKTSDRWANYYQRSGGKGAATLSDGSSVNLGNIFSSKLKGVSRPNADVNTNINTVFKGVKRPLGKFTILGENVNHDTAPGFVSPEAISELK